MAEPQPGAPVFTAGGIRALDADLAAAGLLELTMELAGARVADALNARFPEGAVLVLAGGGANGGDALVAARHLHAAGRELRVLALAGGSDLARAMRDRLERFVAVDALTPGSLAAALPASRVVLDGLLGTGFEPPLRPELAQVIGQLNAADKQVVSIDLPSGLNADAAGEQPGQDQSDQDQSGQVRADLTLALVGLKPALLFMDVGEVCRLDLGVPPGLLARHARAWTSGAAELRAWLPKRKRGAHKGDAGKLYVLGGQSGYTGAPAMTALAAIRTGAGLVTLYSRADIPGHPLEAMAHRLERWDALDDLPRPDALAVGMGLPQDGEAVARRVLAWRVPTVLDAGALQPDLAGAGHDQVVWTPHPGEAARLLQTQVGEVTRDPLAAAERLRAHFGGSVVLKGGPTVVATPEGLWVCPHGNPGMATGGMGDVLSGVIAALLGQGLGAGQAAVAGVTLHALAGDRVAARLGYGLSATDVAHELAVAWHDLTTSV